jgi:hypothetical protein
VTGVTAAATAVLWTLLAGIGGTAMEVQVGGRTETSARGVAPRGGATQSVVNFDLLPRLDLRLAGKRLRGTVAYEPQLRATRDLGGAVLDLGTAHAGTASAEWDLSPGWRVSAAARASERLVDLATASSEALTRLLELGAAPSTVRYVEAGASAAVEGGLTPRLALASSVALDSSGGRGAAGRAAVPGLRRLRLAAGLVRGHTRRDVLRADVSAVEAAFDAGGTASLATLTGEWAHDATRRVRFRLAAGASGARAEGAPTRALPEGRAALEWTPTLLGGTLRAAAAIATGAALDRWRATAYERIGIDGDVAWPASGRFTLRALASRGWAREPGGVTAGRAELRALWRASPRLAVSGGAWSEWQRDPELAAARSVTSWGSTLGVELAPLWRLSP